MCRNIRLALILLLSASLGVLTQCGVAGGGIGAEDDGSSAFDRVYDVLMHPRCMNCHPAGRVPLQGDDSRPHGQNVQGGADGLGRFAMRCSNCHGTANAPGEHTPPGAPNWHLPAADMPLVFQGRSKADLARQLADPQHNGGRSPEQLLEHLRSDPLVLWGWQPGEGRARVPIPHEDFVAAAAAWIRAGCPVPE
ncbi:MAG: hypothetical protein AB7I19_18925 [Planctomycetota bacterium]